MSTLRLGKSINENDFLWRYITLDVFIDLLDKEHIFFTPTAFYEKADPFEGFLPEVALKAFAQTSSNYLTEMRSKREALVKIVEDKYGGINTEQQKQLVKFDESIEDFKGHLRRSYPAIAKGVNVSCWHRNDYESEAMWRLYSQSGVVIKSSVGLIKKSMESNGEDHIIHVAPVKYLDFYDKNLKASDCVSDGYTIGLIKRASFSHENEIRFFIVGNIDERNPENFVPKPIKVKADVGLLIEKIYISPFSVEPFISSVYAICKKYGISAEIVEQSRLLKGHEELLDALSL